MKISKRDITFLVIGIIIASSAAVFAGSYNAKQISFTPNDSTWNVKNVSSALDNIKQTDKTEIANLQSAVANKQAVIDQYSEYSFYTGNTTFTPSTSSQTISTNKKMLNSNITINAIPNEYKKLNSTTTAVASDLALGKTAYNSSGELITGTLKKCIHGELIADSNMISSSGKRIETGFKVKIMDMYFYDDSSHNYYNSYIDATKLYDGGNNGNHNPSDYLTIANNYIIVKNYNIDIGKRIYYIFCN